jgi:hypothetical protein
MGKTLNELWVRPIKIFRVLRWQVPAVKVQPVLNSSSSKQNDILSFHRGMQKKTKRPLHSLGANSNTLARKFHRLARVNAEGKTKMLGFPNYVNTNIRELRLLLLRKCTRKNFQYFRIGEIKPLVRQGRQCHTAGQRLYFHVTQT